jgi:multidrug efflux system outer membrane protein
MQWRASRLAIFGCVCALFNACSVAPTYTRPKVALPAQWQESAGDGAAGSQTSLSVWPAADWWHGFGSAQLDELIAVA